MAPEAAVPLDAVATAQSIRDALQSAVPGLAVDLDDGGTDAAALTFVHPAHEATVLVLVEGAAAGLREATVMVAVVVGDAGELQHAPQGALQLLALNAQMVTGAVAVLPLNRDEMAVVVCRRLAALELQPTEIKEIVDQLIWDYARCSGWLAEAQKTASEPARPRLIGSLDEL
jgi:hypothetical protein